MISTTKTKRLRVDCLVRPKSIFSDVFLEFQYGRISENTISAKHVGTLAARGIHIQGVSWLSSKKFHALGPPLQAQQAFKRYKTKYRKAMNIQANQRLGRLNGTDEP